MPRKVQYTKEQIVQVAIDIIRKDGTCPVVPQHKQGIGLFDKPDLQDLFLDGRADG